MGNESRGEKIEEEWRDVAGVAFGLLLCVLISPVSSNGPQQTRDRRGGWEGNAGGRE